MPVGRDLQQRNKLMDEPKSKLRKTEELDPIFFKFTRDEQRIQDLNASLQAIKLGLSQMNLAILKVLESNARSSLGFSDASCDTVHHMLKTNEGEFNELTLIAGNIFVDGLDILEKYMDKKQPKVPKDDLQRTALAKLLKFISENHEALWEEIYDGREGEWTIRLAQHLLARLAVHNEYILDSHLNLHYLGDSPICPCKVKDQLVGKQEDTSFGCVKGWHGRTDIIMEGLPVSVTEGNAEVSEDCSVSPVDKTEMDQFSGQLLAQTIVYSFLQHKQSEGKLNNYLTPGIRLSRKCVTVNFYDCVNDVLLATRPLELFSGKSTLTFSVVLLLWLTLNYRYFCSGVPDEMKAYKADFFKRVDEDFLEVYKHEVTRPVHECDLSRSEDHSWANNPGMRCNTRKPYIDYMTFSPFSDQN